jgi:hypothetical protein
MLDILSGTFRVILALLVGGCVVMGFVSVAQGFISLFMAIRSRKHGVPLYTAMMGHNLWLRPDLYGEDRKRWLKLYRRAIVQFLLCWGVGFVSMWLLKTLW